MDLIEVQALSFRYRRSSRPALDGVSFALPAGITGIVGPNGAGKSTLFRLLLGGLRPTSGSIALCGLDPDAYLRTRPLGYIPEQPTFEPFLTVAEFLDGLSRIHPPRLAEAAPTAGGGPAGAVDVDEIRNRLLSDLSLGQKRRVEIAAALSGDPDVLLLDEPTNGLDPLAVLQLRDRLLAIRRPGRAILVASHHLDELERIVDRVVVLREGHVEGVWEAADAALRFGSLEGLFRERFSECT